MKFAPRQTVHVHEHDLYRVIVRNDRRATSAARLRESRLKCHVRYPTELADSARPGPCNAGSRRRRCKSATICSTNAACGREKTNKYLGPFRVTGKITR